MTRRRLANDVALSRPVWVLRWMDERRQCPSWSSEYKHEKPV
jgi:hypothetical protein